MGTKPPGPWGGQNNLASASPVASSSSSQQSAASTSFSLGKAAEDALSGTAKSITSAAEAAAATLKVKTEDLQKGIRNDLEGAYCIYVSGIQAVDYAPDAILEETGCQFRAFISGIVPGLVQMLKVVGATTVFGAGIGGAIGFFAGGAGAAPGIVVGGELGFDIGMAALTWMGLGFLALSIAEGFLELYDTLKDGVEWAWQAKDLKGGAQREQLDKAARKIGKAAGILMRLVLQGIVVELLRKPAVAITKRAMTVGGRVGTQGVAVAADASVAELVTKLRSSKFGPDFAKWVEDHWEELKENPKLKPKGTAGSAGGEGSSGSPTDKSTQDTLGPKDEPTKPSPARPTGFEALRRRRETMGLPAAGAEGDAATLSELEIGGQRFQGINRALQDPKTVMTLQRVNAQTITHAEADAVQNAVNAGTKGSAETAEMWVDRDPCGACRGGLRSLARELGVKQLIVNSPSGTKIYTPTP